MRRPCHCAPRTAIRAHLAHRDPRTVRTPRIAPRDPYAMNLDGIRSGFPADRISIDLSPFMTQSPMIASYT